MHLAVVVVGAILLSGFKFLEMPKEEGGKKLTNHSTTSYGMSSFVQPADAVSGSSMPMNISDPVDVLKMSETSLLQTCYCLIPLTFIFLLSKPRQDRFMHIYFFQPMNC